MSWRVVKEFADKTDGYYVYKAGDSFPRNGKQVSQARISELSTDKNALGTSLIKEELDKREVEKAENIAKPKRTRAKQKE